MKYKLPVLVIAAALALAFLSCTPKDGDNVPEFENTGAVAMPVNMIYDNSSVQNEQTDENPEIIIDIPEAEPEEDFPFREKTYSNSHTINMKYILQNPELPTGCEVTSLAMVLNYYGYSITKTDLADKYLKKASLGKAGFDEAFIGNPASDGGYGCFAPVIVETAQKYLIEKTMDLTAWDVSETDFRNLYDYIDEDIPVIVWASMNLMQVNISDAFYDESGESVKWFDNEHCMVLCGYDREQNLVIAADPLKGMMKYDADRFEKIYNELGRQAVIIN